MGESAIVNALNRTDGVDCLVLPSSDKTVTAYAVNVIKESVPKRVYCDSLPENAALLVSENETYPLESSYSSGAVGVRFHAVENKHVVLVETKNISMLVCASKVSNFSSLPQNFRTADLLVCLSDYPEDTADYTFDSAVICANNQKGVAAQNALVYQGVNAVATGGCGDVVIKASKGNFRIGRE